MRFVLNVSVALLLLAAPCGAGSAGEESGPRNSHIGQALQGVSDLKERVERWKDPIPGYEDRYWVVVRASTREERTAIAQTGMAIAEVFEDRVAGTAHRREIELLIEQGFVVLERTSLSVKDFPPADAAYHDYGEMEAVLRNLAAAHPDLVSLFSAGKSVEGRRLWTLRLNTSVSGAGPSSKPGMLVMGTHHAREHLATEVPLLFAVWLCENRDRADVRRLLETRDVYVMPMINPDGVEYDIASGRYRWQRKNMRVHQDGNVGVDLNRNYGYEWGGAGSSGSTWSDTYRGPSAFSEPETTAVKEFVEARPNLKTNVSYHSHGELILYPWSYGYDPIPNARDLEAFKSIARAMADKTGYEAKQSSDLYASSGDTDDWMYGTRGIFSFTFELEGGSFYPGAGAIEPASRKNTAALFYLMSVTGDPHSAIEGAASPAGR